MERKFESLPRNTADIGKKATHFCGSQCPKSLTTQQLIATDQKNKLSENKNKKMFHKEFTCMEEQQN